MQNNNYEEGVKAKGLINPLDTDYMSKGRYFEIDILGYKNTLVKLISCFSGLFKVELPEKFK